MEDFNWMFENIFTYGMPDELLGVFGAVIVVAFLLALAAGLVIYILTSLGLYQIAKRRGLKLYGMAWVPLGQEWLLGSIADQYDRKANGKDKRLRTKLLVFELLILVLSIAIGVLSGLAMAGFDFSIGIVLVLIFGLAIYVLTIVYIVFYYIALYKVYKAATPKHCVWMLVLSIFVNIAIPICLFVIRRKDDGFIELEQQVQQAPDYSAYNA